MLQELERHAPEVLIAARAALADGSSLENGQCRQRELAAGAFAEAPDISVDYALMERSDKVAVVPCSIGWSDIGSWQRCANSARRTRTATRYAAKACCTTSATATSIRRSAWSAPSACTT